jgi:hypothetical protein
MQVNFQFEENDEEVWKRFKSFVMRNEGKIKGELGRYVAEALDAYMDSANKEKIKKFPAGNRNVSLRRAYNVWQELLNGAGFEVGDRVPEAVLERNIKKICGSSDPTIRKYKNLMDGFRLVSEVGNRRDGSKVYEIFDEPEWVEDIE